MPSREVAWETAGLFPVKRDPWVARLPQGDVLTPGSAHQKRTPAGASGGLQSISLYLMKPRKGFKAEDDSGYPNHLGVIKKIKSGFCSFLKRNIQSRWVYPTQLTLEHLSGELGGRGQSPK